MKELFLGPLIAFVLFLVTTRVLEWLKPRGRRLPVLRRGFATDAAYWFFTPIVTKAVTHIALIAALIPVALLIYGQLDRAQLLDGFGPLSRLPLWVQAAVMLVIADFIGYWMHRVFHRGRLWKFHAVHHSSVDLDWLSSVRVHPVNDALMKIAAALPLIALGFKPDALAVITPILTIMAILVHANVDWDFGPLRRMIVSPRFHRWHHTDEAAAINKNFAGLFPIWDIVFGTYHMPAGQVPSTFGTSTPVPPGLLGQLVFPFRKP